MKHTHTKAVVLPVPEVFLSTLVEREANLTALVWGGQGDSGRMAGPHRLLEKDQVHLPFLLSPAEQESKEVTHAAICGWLVHRDEVPASGADWLDNRRVEKFAGTPYSSEVASLFVVTATRRLNPGIPYGQLVLANNDIPLSPGKRRGYSVVYLPTVLVDWFAEACPFWDGLSTELPEIGQGQGHRGKQ